MIVKFREVGNSITITIPSEVVKQLCLTRGMEAEIETVDDSIIVKPIEKRENITLKSLFKDYSGSYKPEEVDWGKAQGNEVW